MQTCRRHAVDFDVVMSDLHQTAREFIELTKHPLTLPPFVWAVHNGHHQLATLFILVCGLLDKLDGLVAKVFDCRSQFGEIFDAITDGICYGFALLLVAWYGWAPPVAVALVLGFGISNTALRFVYARRAGRALNYKSYA